MFDNPTQATGCLVYGAAAAAAWAAQRRRAAGHPGGRAVARAWAWIAGLSALLALEVWLGWRYVLHDGVGAILQSFGDYEGRRPLQVVLLVVLGVAIAAAAWWFRPHRAPNAQVRIARYALWAAFVDVGLELVSLHQIDAVLYAQAGPLLLNGWLWLVLGLVIAGCALEDWRRG